MEETGKGSGVNWEGKSGEGNWRELPGVKVEGNYELEEIIGKGREVDGKKLGGGGWQWKKGN